MIAIVVISLAQLMTLLLKTVRSWRAMRASATACAVVPLARMIEAPSGTRLAATRPMARSPSVLMTWRTVISGSLCSRERRRHGSAQRWPFASATISRRMVSRETPSLRRISVMEIEPRAFTIDWIRRCLFSASKMLVLPLGGLVLPTPRRSLQALLRFLGDYVVISGIRSYAGAKVIRPTECSAENREIEA